MKILITDFFGIMAGSSYSAFYLAKGLQEKGHEVWVAYKRDSFMEELVKSSQLKALPIDSARKFDLFVARRLSKFVKANDIEITNAQASPDRYITIFARWFFGMPGKLIHTRRQKPDTSGGSVKAQFYFRGTDQIIAVSCAIRKFLINSGIPNSHIKVIPNGIPELKWKSLDESEVSELKIKYGIKNGDLVIGCVSRIKKQEQILKAAVYIEKPLKIIFVGIENEFPALKRLSETLPSKHQVIFTGEIGNDEVLHHFPLFDLKVLASDMEGFSQSILEAMALGVPVIATDASGNPDLIEHEENGFLFEDGNIQQLANLILKVHDDDMLRLKVIEKARNMARNKYNLDVMLSKYEDAFTK